MVLKEALGATWRGARNGIQSVPYPVPTRGVNALSAYSALEPNEAHYLYNILPAPQGVKVRKGTKEYSNDVGYNIRTTMSYVSKDPSGLTDKLFCTGEDGIYEMASGTGNASKVYSFATTGATAGYGNYVQWTAANGDQYLYYADSANGLLEYDAGADTWSAVTGITGISELDVRFIAVHKLRIWLILEDDPNGYYLPTDSNSGAATAFQLGPKFLYGSELAGIFNLSFDAGDGLDDFFVAISRAGDALVYQGTDPSSASTWGLVGRWQVGAIPEGRKFAAEFMGDVMIVSSFGVVSLKDVINGEATHMVRDPRGYDKIANLIRTRMVDERTTEGWETLVNFSEGTLIIQSPQRSGNADEWLHYIYDANTQAWGFWRDVKSKSMTELRGVVYYGNAEGELWYMDGGEDGVTLADPTGSPEAVVFSMLTAYSNCGQPGVLKRGTTVVPVFRSEQLDSYDVKILYDYDFIEMATPSFSGTPDDQAEWDTAVWDTALWGGIYKYDKVFSSLGDGMGRSIAVAIKGSSRGTTTLMELNMSFQSGGII